MKLDSFLVFIILLAMHSDLVAHILKVPEEFSKLSEAYASAEAGDVIEIAAGDYQLPAPVVINKDVTFRGEDMDKVQIFGLGAFVFDIRAGMPVFEKLTITALRNEVSSAVFRVSGGSMTASECRISGKYGDGIRLSVEEDDFECISRFQKCTIENCGMNGICASFAQAKFEHCTISKNKHGVSMDNNARILFANCRIINASDGEIGISYYARGDFEKCTITGKAPIGVGIAQSGWGSFRECRISGYDFGIMCAQGGIGKFIDCRILENARGIAAVEHGEMTLEKCELQGPMGVTAMREGNVTMKDSSVSKATIGVSVGSKSKAALQNCRIQSCMTGVFVNTQGKGSFFRNTLECTGKCWDIHTNAGIVSGSGNTPALPGSTGSDFLKTLLERTEKR